jgi:hypothetical protein
VLFRSLLELGHPEFDKRFAVYALSTDDIRVIQQILTPHTMEVIMRLHDYSKKHCGFSITREGRLQFHVYTKKRVFTRKLNLKKAEQEIFEDISYITDVLDGIFGIFPG